MATAPRWLCARCGGFSEQNTATLCPQCGSDTDMVQVSATDEPGGGTRLTLTTDSRQQQPTPHARSHDSDPRQRRPQ